ncbi:MAG: hypothetical protein VKJ64_20920 [Leptolyngbyaceae bacterium]|nr:hypothetical protein [Leptolyngbyaceae bacterium]
MKSPLFSQLSEQSASQTQGGHWGYSKLTIRVVVPTAVPSAVAYAAPVSTSTRAGSINISNPDIDDGAIVTFSGAANITMTNPDIDDGAILTF